VENKLKIFKKESVNLLNSTEADQDIDRRVLLLSLPFGQQQSLWREREQMLCSRR
jgi:hypothetical protein